MNTITFTRESLNKYKIECEKAKLIGETHFVWKGSINNVQIAINLIDKLEKSDNLTIKH